MLVVDSSILLSALLPDEDGPELTALLATHGELLAPGLLWVEVRNIVLAAERRGRLSGTEADSIVAAIDDLGITLDNVEGMTFGPDLPDGRRTLVLVSDDNFSESQVTQFLAFALEGGAIA